MDILLSLRTVDNVGYDSKIFDRMSVQGLFLLSETGFCQELEEYLARISEGL